MAVRLRIFDFCVNGFKWKGSTKKKENKSFEINDSKFEIYYDLSLAQYGAGAELVEGYYVLIMVDSELGMLIGDLTEESTMKKLKSHKQISKFALISRKEHFSDTGSWHDVLIQCAGETEGLKYPGQEVAMEFQGGKNHIFRWVIGGFDVESELS
ncbi:hypothetical protein L1987_20883 [Smallanthus sonchifolius]|uniref:Uncharacterized protein n=1 Tax=Smallanthus sonchifolius TaxID=185202 RepID=A0ACB9IUJ0_9ASTR|nr:hypothetical protein L1987_20883 [Smallanthus sonchifolius]